jgi:hypothetical protein
MLPPLFHGGVAGLQIGDLLEPGHSRDNRHPGCPVCEARARGETYQVDGHGMDPPSSHPDRVYLTPVRLYALFHASMYGRGDLYLAEPLGELEKSIEDPFPAFYAERARVVAVPQRSVLMRPSERRKLAIAWGRIEGISRRDSLDEHRRMLRRLVEGGGL